MGSSWKLILVFTVLFFIGGLSGSVGTAIFLRRHSLFNPTRNAQSWTNDLMQRIDRHTKLTSEQRDRIRPRIEAAVKQMQTIRAQAMLQGSDAFDAAIAEIEAQLQPDQQRRLERFRQDRRRHLERLIERLQQ